MLTTVRELRGLGRHYDGGLRVQHSSPVAGWLCISPPPCLTLTKSTLEGHRIKISHIKYWAIDTSSVLSAVIR